MASTSLLWLLCPVSLFSLGGLLWWLGFITEFASVAFAVIGGAGVLTLVVPGLAFAYFSLALGGAQDLKKKYGNVEWALVTGGSSGIGKAIVERLCAQGINVIIVAVPDKVKVLRGIGNRTARAHTHTHTHTHTLLAAFRHPTSVPLRHPVLWHARAPEVLHPTQRVQVAFQCVTLSCFQCLVTQRIRCQWSPPMRGPRRGLQCYVFYAFVRIASHGHLQCLDPRAPSHA